MRYDHIQTFQDTSLTFKMIHIEGDSFDMGSRDGNLYGAGVPLHSVSVPNYWLAEYLVTQSLWLWVMKDTEMPDPSNFKGQNLPVENVSWDAITKVFLPKLNELTKNQRPENRSYRLPTEAEWEYAAKGGKYWNIFPFKYSGSDKLNEVGWFSDRENTNSHDETMPVGLKTHNLLGIYDMSGNVYEWCQDSWHSDYIDAPTDGSARESKEDKYKVYVRRGGAFNRMGIYSLPTYRNGTESTVCRIDHGFRLAL
jgi:formylglycine-generating enzyme